MKILYFDDYHFLYSTIKHISKQYAFIVDIVQNKKDAQLKLKLNNYDLMIVNLNADYQLAKDFILELRQKEKNNIPIIAISENLSDEEKIYLLEYYIDEILIKPFNWHELMLKARNIYFRMKTFNLNIQHWHNYGELKLNESSQTIIIKNQKIKLRYKEFLIFKYLINNPNRIISKEELIEKLWDQETDLFSNSINVHLYNLRKKIKELSNIDIIKTIRGRGVLLNLTELL